MAKLSLLFTELSKYIWETRSLFANFPLLCYVGKLTTRVGNVSLHIPIICKVRQGGAKDFLGLKFTISRFSLYKRQFWLVVFGVVLFFLSHTT